MSLMKFKPLRITAKEFITKLSIPSFLSPGEVIFFVLIIVIGYLAYGLFFVPAIFMDDWTSVIERIITGNAHWLDLEFRNPLLFTPFLIQYRLFGTNLSAYYLVIWLLLVLQAILLYFIVIRFPLLESRAFSLIVAILYLIYPTIYTHIWMIQLGIYCGIVLTFLYGYLLLRYAEGANWLTLALALICLMISFGFYEGQVGVVSAWALFLAVLFRRSTIKRLLGLLTPIVLVGAFALWRTFGFQSAGVDDQYLSRVIITPGVLIYRLLLGYKISLGWGWTYSIDQLLNWVSGSKQAAFLLAVLTIACWWIANRIITRNYSIQNQTGGKSSTLDHRWAVIRPYIYSAFTGLALIGAGYVPVLIVYLPSLSGIGSRHNTFATIGGAIFFASVLMIGVLLFAKDLSRVRYQFLAAALPFVLLGVITQTSVQYHNRVAWREQQNIWRELFSEVPDIKDDTMVLFVLPGYQDRTGFYNWKRIPLTASWEVSSGVRLLYNNPTLYGDVYFPDIDQPIEPSLTAKGVYTQDTDTLTPYSRTVVLVYDNEAVELSKIDEIPAEWIQDADSALMTCQECILDNSDQIVPLRSLVED